MSIRPDLIPSLAREIRTNREAIIVALVRRLDPQGRGIKLTGAEIVEAFTEYDIKLVPDCSADGIVAVAYLRRRNDR